MFLNIRKILGSIAMVSLVVVMDNGYVCASGNPVINPEKKLNNTNFSQDGKREPQKVSYFTLRDEVWCKICTINEFCDLYKTSKEYQNTVDLVLKTILPMYTSNNKIIDQVIEDMKKGIRLNEALSKIPLEDQDIDVSLTFGAVSAMAAFLEYINGLLSDLKFAPLNITAQNLPQWLTKYPTDNGFFYENDGYLIFNVTPSSMKSLEALNLLGVSEDAISKLNQRISDEVQSFIQNIKRSGEQEDQLNTTEEKPFDKDSLSKMEKSKLMEIILELQSNNTTLRQKLSSSDIKVSSLKNDLSIAKTSESKFKELESSLNSQIEFLKREVNDLRAKLKLKSGAKDPLNQSNHEATRTASSVPYDNLTKSGINVGKMHVGAATRSTSSKS